MVTLNIYLCFQDEANKRGGKWIIRLKKGLASRCWENVVLAMMGEQFMVGEEICGAVISVRFLVSNMHKIWFLDCKKMNKEFPSLTNSWHARLGQQPRRKHKI